MHRAAPRSPRRGREGGAEHIGLDHLPYVSTYVADWVSDVFRSLPATG